MSRWRKHADVAMRTLLLFLSLPLGAGMGFLCLEFIGIIFLVPLWYSARMFLVVSSQRAIAQALFGLGFAGLVVWDAFVPQNVLVEDLFPKVWFGLWGVAGCAMVLVGIWQLRRRTPK